LIKTGDKKDKTGNFQKKWLKMSGCKWK